MFQFHNDAGGTSNFYCVSIPISEDNLYLQVTCSGFNSTFNEFWITNTDITGNGRTFPSNARNLGNMLSLDNVSVANTKGKYLTFATKYQSGGNCYFYVSALEY